MPAPTPGYVKNMIRRCFREQIDKSPTNSQVKRIWEYFGSSCAYCGKPLDRSKKEGHIDHLVPASQGGANNISNRVLSCATCNEKEKLDEDWKVFLKNKIEDHDIREERINKIEKWVEGKIHEHQTVPEDLLEEVNMLADETVKIFDSGIEKVRSIR